MSFCLPQDSDNSLIKSNATIEIDGIKHSIVSTRFGDYFRLLTPGKSYTVSAIAQGYERNVASQVYVSSNVVIDDGSGLLSAKVVNFTLIPDQSSEWSKKYDFGIEENLSTQYVSNDQMRTAYAELENAFPDYCEAKMNEADWNTKVPVLYLHGNETGLIDQEKINLALFGSVYGAQPVGRELLIRLARHLCHGYTNHDAKSRQLLDNANLYLFPMVDYDFFDPAHEGDCGYDRQESMNHELGSKFRRAEAPYYKRAQPAKAAAIEFFFQTHNISVALSLEGEGIFARLPYDNDGVSYQRQMHPSAKENLNILAQAYLQVMKIRIT